MIGVKIFVATAYLILGASFYSSTWLVISEFQELDWPAMVMVHSHLFFFFPVFGVLALVAFYLPSVVFTHLYWYHLQYGKLRFLLGLTVLTMLSFFLAVWLDREPRAIWEVSPSALRADQGGCGSNVTQCMRAGIPEVLREVRKEAQQRVGLSKFARNCATDPMLEPPEELDAERQCFPANGKLKAAACCEVQSHFAAAVSRLQSSPATRSLYAHYDGVFLPLKIFFVLIVITVGVLSSMWRNAIDLHYRDLVPAVERGVIVGALAMLFWPAMDYGYQQTANTLFGRWQTNQLRLSLIIVPWVLLLLFYFLRRLGRQGAMIGQIAGLVTASVALLRYEELNDWAVRLVGAGAQAWIVCALVVVALAGFLVLLLSLRSDLLDYPRPSR